MPDGSKQTFRFTNWRTVIGRSRSCDLTLVSSQVSKSHAAIEIINGVISIRDLGSRNGIAVNGTLISRQRELYGDDKVLLGDVELTIDAQSQIFENTPSRQLVDLIFEEKSIRDSSAGLVPLDLDTGPSLRGLTSGIISRLRGKPEQSVNGGEPVLRVLRITEDYIPRTVFRIAPFTFRLELGELCWIRPTLDLAQMPLDSFENVTHFTFDEREDAASNPGSAILLRSYYRLKGAFEVVNFRESARSSDGLRVFSERSTFEPLELKLY